MLIGAENIWILLALFSSFGTAALLLCNQFFKQDGFLLVVTNKFFLMLFAFRFVLMIGWPSDTLFYVCVVATVPCSMIADRTFLTLASEYGGGPVSRLSPFAQVLIFGGWFAVHPVLLLGYLQTPLLFAGIILAVSGAVFCASLTRHDPVSKTLIRRMIPFWIAVAVVTMLNKTAMDVSDFHSGVWAYVFVQALGVSIVGGAWIGLRKNMRQRLQQNYKKVLAASACLSLAALTHLVFKNYAFTYVDNPAYVTLIDMTHPFWILLVNKAVGHPDKHSVLPGFGVVFFAALMIVLVRLI